MKREIREIVAPKQPQSAVQAGWAQKPSLRELVREGYKQVRKDLTKPLKKT